MAAATAEKVDFGSYRMEIVMELDQAKLLLEQAQVERESLQQTIESL